MGREESGKKNAKRLKPEDLDATAAQKQMLNGLDSRFYYLDAKQSLMAILSLYVVKHVEDFRPLLNARGE